MTRLLLIGLAVLAAFALGVGIGWRAGSAGQAKAEAKQAQRDGDALAASVQQQSTNLQRRMQAQQDASTALLVAQRATRGHVAAITLEIEHAQFDAPAAAGECPDELGSDDFVRLYDAAATAGAAAAAPAGSTR